jgi:hypothetical protein
LSTFNPLDEDGWINMGADVVKQDVDEVRLVDGVLNLVAMFLNFYSSSLMLWLRVFP